eukprot:jgi/Bigna1/81313/fgenesh1_pg.79_\
MPHESLGIAPEGKSCVGLLTTTLVNNAYKPCRFSTCDILLGTVFRVNRKRLFRASNTKRTKAFSHRPVPHQEEPAAGMTRWLASSPDRGEAIAIKLLYESEKQSEKQRTASSPQTGSQKSAISSPDYGKVMDIKRPKNSQRDLEKQPSEPDPSQKKLKTITFKTSSKEKDEPNPGDKRVGCYRGKKMIRRSLSTHIIQTIRHIDDISKDLWLSAVIVGFNAILMMVTEIIIEVLILTELYPKLPFRLDFFFLTILSALLGWQALEGIAHKQFDTSINALQVSGLVEAALITGDVVFMETMKDEYPAAISTRAPFAILTGTNLVLVAYMYANLWWFHHEEDEKGGSRWKL